MAVWARKCRPYIGDQLHPAYRLRPISVRAMRCLNGVADRVAAEYPAASSELLPEVLVLHGALAMYGVDEHRFAVDRSGIRPVAGAHRLLLDAGANFAIAAEHVLAEHLRPGRLAVLPEIPTIAVRTAALLRPRPRGQKVDLALGLGLGDGDGPACADEPVDLLVVQRPPRQLGERTADGPRPPSVPWCRVRPRLASRSFRAGGTSPIDRLAP